MNSRTMQDGQLATDSHVAWDQVRARIEAEIGMDLAGSRFPRLREAVHKVLSEKPGIRLEQVLGRTQERCEFLERLTAELTVGETYFFRNEHHFRALEEQVIPTILDDNQARREIRAWSAGCATGEEAYSLAILLDQLLAGRAASQQHGPWQACILGTDLNREFLERARHARYRSWSFRHTNIQHDGRYFVRDADTFRLVPRVRDHVRFAYMNLVKDAYPSPLNGTLGLDLVLFRNVAIYLKPEVTKAIIERFYHALRPGGWLLLGEAEVHLAPRAGFQLRQFGQAAFYQKSSHRDAPVPDQGPPALPLSTLIPSPRRAPAGSPLRAAATPRAAASPPAPGPLAFRPLPDFGATRLASGATQAVGQQVDASWERIAGSLAAGRFDEAERAFEPTACRGQRAALRLRYARALLAHGQTALARAMIESCVKDEPLVVEAQILKASLAEEAGDDHAAEQAYRRALYIDRNCSLAHFHLALLQRRKCDAAGAARSLRTTLALIERNAPQALVEHGEGICYGRLKEMALFLV